MKRKIVFAGSAITLLLAFVIGALMYNSEMVSEASKTVTQNRAALMRLHAPTLGNADARVHIVEFLDPACGTCAAFYPFVKRMMAANPDKIRLFIRYAPLHPGSDQVVAALEAARKQGMYWEALGALLNSQSQWVINHTAHLNLAWQPLARVGVNVEQARHDMRSPEIARLIAQDIEDTRTLNVTKTPEFFVNGRPLPKFGYEELQQLVSQALRNPIGSALRSSRISYWSTDPFKEVMMKKLALCGIAILGLAWIPAHAQMKMEGMGKMEHSAKPAAIHRGDGVVKKVDLANGIVTLAHDPVKSLNWPAMTMDFRVRDKASLATLKPEQKIEFELVEEKKGSYVISRIK